MRFTQEGVSGRSEDAGLQREQTKETFLPCVGAGERRAGAALAPEQLQQSLVTAVGNYSDPVR